MTVSEWDGTAWSGTTPEYGNRAITAGTPKGVYAKAATGWESIYNGVNIPHSAMHRGPLGRMREEQALYWTHPWVRVAERAVTSRVAGLPWHIEDANADEVDDETIDPRIKAVVNLLEKPQMALPPKERQPGIRTWYDLIKITSRHLGLCGMAHWYPDQPDADGVPLALMYVNPARMFPVTTTTGQLVAWSLDPKDDEGRGGTLLEPDEVLTFYLEPPDSGGVSSGLVQAAWLKAQITLKSDYHYLDVLSTGGRLAGLVSPKAGKLGDGADEFPELQRQLRSAQDSGDTSKRLVVLRGPVDYTRTAGTSQELDLTGYAAMSRSDILTVWGVPDSQAGVQIEAGLNSGSTKEADEPVLFQGAVHDRVLVISPTIQFGLLDRWTEIKPQLVIEEPSFDDDMPAYDKAAKAKTLPLTRNQRLAMVNEDPLPEYGPDGEPLGLAIDLPIELTVVGQGEEPAKLKVGRFTQVPQPEPIVTIPEIPLLGPGEPPAKAAPLARDAVVRRFEPALRKSIGAFLREQAAEIASRVTEMGGHLAEKPSDRFVWWNEKRWDAKLTEVVRSTLSGLASSVVGKVTASMGTRAKADSFTTSVLEAILKTVGTRIRGINQATRDAIAALIGDGFANGLSPAEVAATITGAASFDDARAELIARTETALVYNEAALRSYDEYGVTEVEAIDGDEDEECAQRNGQTFSLDEALSIEDHPNGTLDWLPVLAPAKATSKIRVEKIDGAWVLEAIA